MNPFLISAGINLVGGLLGRRDEEQQARENSDLAYQRSRQENKWALKQNRKDVRKARAFDVAQSKVAERRGDENANQARKYNSEEARKAERFSAAQADKANALSEERDLRNREWAKEDYDQQKEDYGTQFQRLRESAESAGFNPLSVLGSQMTPGAGAGGLSSSSYGAGGGVAASSGFATPNPVTAGSVPMTYGAEVSVQPLVSNAGILGAVTELGRELTGANAIARETDELYRDLAEIELEKARSGVTAAPQTAPGNYPSAPAGAVPNLGNTAVPVGDVSTTPSGDTWDDAYGNTWNTGEMPRPWRYGDDGGIIEYVPSPQTSMTGVVANQATGGNAVVPLDPSGEVLTGEQLATVGAILAPQAVVNHMTGGQDPGPTGPYAVPPGGNILTDWRDWIGAPPVAAPNVQNVTPTPWTENYTYN